MIPKAQLPFNPPPDGVMTIDWVKDSQARTRARILRLCNINSECVAVCAQTTLPFIKLHCFLPMQRKFTQVIARRAVLRLYDQLESRSGRQVFYLINPLQPLTNCQQQKMFPYVYPAMQLYIRSPPRYIQSVFALPVHLQVLLQESQHQKTERMAREAVRRDKGSVGTLKWAYEGAVVVEG